jgi:hypothetical protein
MTTRYKYRDYGYHNEESKSFRDKSYFKCVREDYNKVYKKLSIPVSVDGRKFDTVTAAAAFMNTFASDLSKRLRAGKKDFKGYSIGYWEDDEEEIQEQV